MKAFIILFLLFSELVWSQTNSADTTKDGFFSETTVATDFAEHGLTQTENDPNFRGSLGYRASGFEGGLWGSNVRFPSDSEHLELKFFAGFNVNFNADFKLSMGIGMSQFYKSDNRNFNETDLGFIFYGYRLHFMQNTNFEATRESSTHVSFGKDFDIPWTLKLNVDLEYVIPKDEDYKKYFVISTGVSYPWQNVTPSLKLIYNSDAKQFDERGKPMIIATISARI